MPWAYFHVYQIMQEEGGALYKCLLLVFQLCGREELLLQGVLLEKSCSGRTL